MKIYKNDVSFASLDPVKNGFIMGLVEDAEQNFREWDASALGFSEKEYAKVERVAFSPENVDADSVNYAIGIVDSFFADADEAQKKLVEDMTDNQKLAFGVDLFFAVLYDSNILDDAFFSAVNAMPHVDASGSIGKSTEGDVRVFFE